MLRNKSVSERLSCFHGVTQGLVDAVLIARYFLWVGSVLLAMIFIVGWLWPSAVPAPVQETSAAAEPPANSMILRIQSARKWPDKIVFDTSAPIIVAPPALPVVAAIAAPVVTATAAAVTPLDARAEMKPAPPKRVARVHRRNVRPAVSNWAAANPSGYPSTWASASPMAPNWSHW